MPSIPEKALIDQTDSCHYHLHSTALAFRLLGAIAGEWHWHLYKKPVKLRPMLNLDAPELYYLANFRKALAWLDAHHRDLMDDAERAFVADFPQLPLPAQALLVRLVMRKGIHFRVRSPTAHREAETAKAHRG